MLSKVFDKVLFGSNILIIVVAFYALDSDYIFYNSKNNQNNLKNHQD